MEGAAGRDAAPILPARRRRRALRLVAVVPPGCDPGDALVRFAKAAAEPLREVGAATDTRVAHGQPRVLRRDGATRLVLCVPLQLEAPAEAALRDRLGASGFLSLGAPWFGAAALSDDTTARRKQLRITNLPPHLELEDLQAFLAERGVHADDLAHPADPHTGLPRYDLAHCTVSAAGRLPDTLTLTHDGATFTLRLYPASTLPPPPQWAAAGGAAGAAAGGASAGDPAPDGDRRAAAPGGAWRTPAAAGGTPSLRDIMRQEAAAAAERGAERATAAAPRTDSPPKGEQPASGTAHAAPENGMPADEADGTEGAPAGDAPHEEGSPPTSDGWRAAGRCKPRGRGGSPGRAASPATSRSPSPTPAPKRHQNCNTYSPLAGVVDMDTCAADIAADVAAGADGGGSSDGGR